MAGSTRLIIAAGVGGSAVLGWLARLARHGGEEEDGVLQGGDGVALVRQAAQLSGGEHRFVLTGHADPADEDLDARGVRRVVLGQLGALAQREDGLAQHAVADEQLGAAAVLVGPGGLQVGADERVEVGHRSSFGRWVPLPWHSTGGAATVRRAGAWRTGASGRTGVRTGSCCASDSVDAALGVDLESGRLAGTADPRREADVAVAVG